MSRPWEREEKECSVVSERCVVLCADENECCEVREICVEVNSVCFMSEVRECINSINFFIFFISDTPLGLGW